MTEDESKPKKKNINDVDGWRFLVLLPLFVLHRLWCASLRFQVSGRAAELLQEEDAATVYLSWHNRLFIVGEVYRRLLKRQSKGIYGLVSASKDGAWFVALSRMSGLKAIRGSSSARGMEATRDLLRVLKNGYDIGITPDGPRGPRYTFKKGAVMLARLSNSPVILIGLRFKNASQLKSWDGFFIPRPFSVVEIDIMKIDSIKDLEAEQGQGIIDYLTDSLLEVNQHQ